ncbi:MAG: hypothetical protein IH856_25125 [Deltaproteobacteria bacterium]|nr:hypothetical protein [Deltaproteobacteria bacterium]
MRKISAKIGVTALSAFALFAVSIPLALSDLPTRVGWSETFHRVATTFTPASEDI